jgi:hypothetical protein
MHWLTGSDTKEQTNTLWRVTGALDNSVKIHCHEPFMEYDHNGTPIDVATPLTYERYCANWKGSWKTEMLPGMKMKT